MDAEKWIVFFKTLGFPTAVALWFMWKVQVFMDALLTSQTQVVELLRQLIEIHR